MNFIKLNNGNKIPTLGFGTYKLTNQNEVTTAIHTAIDNGYILIDTAEVYGNERQIGKALQTHDSKRGDLFLTSKIWNTHQSYDATMKSFEKSLKYLQTDYLDLYLIHWPFSGDFLDTWKALENIYEQGLAKNIGVCNFHQHHLEKLFTNSNVIPAVNQIELQPYLSQNSLREFCNKHNIVVESWSPIAKGQVQNDNILEGIGKKHKKTATQITLRWHVQQGLIAIPKSANPSRIKQNIDIFDFKLSESEILEINNLNKNMHIGPNPDNFVM